MKKTLITGFTVLLFAIAVVTFTINAEAGKPTIKHYGIFDLTGPYGVLVPDSFEGMVDYYRYVNEELGGIDGHPVKMIWGETGNVMSRTWSHYKRYKRAKAQFLWLYSTPDGESLKRRLEKDNMCAFNFSSTEPQIFPPGRIYGDGCTYSEAFAAFLILVKREWEKEGKKGNPRVGVIGPDTNYGRALELGKEYGKEIGVDVVGQEYPPVVPMDLTPQVLRLKNKGVDWIWLQGLSQIGTIFLKNMETLGLQGKVKVAGFWWASGSEMLRRIHPKYSEGYVFTSFTYIPGVDTDNPGLKKCNDMRKKYHNKDANEVYVKGVRAVQFIMELTGRTLKKYGYKGLTAENYMSMTASFKDWRSPWDLGAPFEIAPNDRRTAKKLLFYQVKDGKVVRYSDWIDAPHLYPEKMAHLFEK